jgi:hypothetical protein
MLECLIIGDGVATGLAEVMPHCAALVRPGVTSSRWMEKYSHHPTFSEKRYRVLVISISTNDLYNSNTEENLYDMRKRAQADMIIWLLPNVILRPNQHGTVKRIAAEFGDKILHMHGYYGPDATHPSSRAEYDRLAQKISKISVDKINR